MKKIISLLFSILIISCNKNQSCDHNQKIRELETKNIIQSFCFDTTKCSLPICTSLKKLIIRTDLKAQMEEKDSIIIVIPKKVNLISQHTEIFIEKLLGSKFDGKLIFSKKDSLNFIEQNFCFSNYNITKEITQKTKTISLSKLKNDNITNEFIIFSIPIFSSDNKKAYIEIDIYSKMYRHGESYFLEKNKGKWRVIYSATNWSAC